MNASASPIADLKEDSSLRHPIGLTWADPDRTVVAVANRIGTVSLLDTQAHHVISEFRVGTSLSAITRIPEMNALILLDPEQDRIRLIKSDDFGNQSTRRAIRVDRDPRRLSISASGAMVAVSSRWSRRLSLFKVSESGEDSMPGLSLQSVIDFPFAPGVSSFLPGSRFLVVADYFAGNIALVDTESAVVICIHNYPINNIGNVWINSEKGNQVGLISGESLNPKATTFRSEIQWGVLMGNHLRRLDFNKWSVDASEDDLFGKVFSLGDERGPGGDPGAIAVTSKGVAIVALSGVDRIAFLDYQDGRSVFRTSVGDRPTSLLLSKDEKTVYVSNQFSDSVSVVDIETGDTVREVPLGPRPELTSVDRGERFFHDANLSPRGWFSCHSCHTDGHTNGLINDNLSDDGFGAPKKIPPLQGAEQTEPMAWLGNVERIEDQILKSLEKTMLVSDPDPAMARDLVAYITSLPIPPGLATARANSNPLAVNRGQRLFLDRGCNNCHRPPAYTSSRTYNVGMQDEVGHRKFNPPSLRAVSQRQFFFHDNRAISLEKVFSEHGHPDPDDELSSQEISDLISFLRTL